MSEAILKGGICGSYGYAKGIAVIKPSFKKPPKYRIDDIDAEISRFLKAQSFCEARINALIDNNDNAEKSALEILKAYRTILRDNVFFKKPISRLESEKINIEYLVYDECKKAAAKFLSFEDSYLRERASDIENVCNELILVMMGVDIDFKINIDSHEGAVVVANDLTPTETMNMDKSFLQAFITEKGGATSHTVILAKTLGIPAIVGLQGATALINGGDLLLVDAFNGLITVNPEAHRIAEFQKLYEDFNTKLKKYDEDIESPAITIDNRSVNVNVNIGDPDSIQSFDATICDGIGLFRTEFIYMNQKDFPDEETQYLMYRDIAERAFGKEVIIRTLDIGGDKQADYMNLPKEENPFLGYRAIRFSLDRRDIFHTQLRAILRASAYGNVKIMFPMIVNVEELRRAKECVEEAKHSLEVDGIKFNKDIPVGIMIETPAAVLASDKLAPESSFFSVGSNDLIQYITATDRLNDKVQYLYDSCNLSVLQAIKMVAHNAKAANIPWGICGEVASEDRLIPLWVTLGISELSVPQVSVGKVKYLIRKIDCNNLNPEFERIFEMSLIEEAKHKLDDILSKLL